MQKLKQKSKISLLDGENNELLTDENYQVCCRVVILTVHLSLS